MKNYFYKTVRNRGEVSFRFLFLFIPDFVSRTSQNESGTKRHPLKTSALTSTANTKPRHHGQFSPKLLSHSTTCDFGTQISRRRTVADVDPTEGSVPQTGVGTRASGLLSVLFLDRFHFDQKYQRTPGDRGPSTQCEGLTTRQPKGPPKNDVRSRA